MKLRELAALPPSEKREAITKLVRRSMRARDPENPSEAELEILELERRHGMSTADMLTKLSDGSLEETEEIVLKAAAGM